jgi:opacity protein-like surface antigen
MLSPISLYGRFYVGGTISCNAVMPSVYWNNIVRQQWMVQNKARADVAIGEWNASVLPVNPEVTFSRSKIEGIAPEVLLLEQKYKIGPGGALYAGAAKITTARFYYGAELKFVVKGISIKRSSQNNELFNGDDAFIVYHLHRILGKVTYSMDFEYQKSYECSASVRLGYFPTNRILGYAKFGVSVHKNKYKDLRIKTATTLSVVRYDDDAYLEYFESTFLKGVNASSYSIPKKSQLYASLNLGVGADYFLSRRIFLRAEYEFKIAPSSRLSSQEDANANEDIYKAFSLRYQDKEHCFSLGVGVYL